MSVISLHLGKNPENIAQLHLLADAAPWSTGGPIKGKDTRHTILLFEILITETKEKIIRWKKFRKRQVK